MSLQNLLNYGTLQIIYAKCPSPTLTSSYPHNGVDIPVSFGVLQFALCITQEGEKMPAKLEMNVAQSQI
jgi:hypothetical protein